MNFMDNAVSDWCIKWKQVERFKVTEIWILRSDFHKQLCLMKWKRQQCLMTFDHMNTGDIFFACL